MDEHLLSQLSPDTAILVPTSSLGNHLNETVAAHMLDAGAQVWEAPNIVSWVEFLRTVWQANRTEFDQLCTLLNPQQCKLLWTQAIEQSKYENAELTLLNVSQTVKACMRSDRLLADWRCNEKALAQDHISDIEQFIAWRKKYHAALLSRGAMDAPMLQSKVLELLAQGRLELPVTQVIWYAYDLITKAQQEFNQTLAGRNIQLEFIGPNRQQTVIDYARYEDEISELTGVFQQARQLLEQQPEQNISIVIPDLRRHHAQVQEIARQTFYPNASLTEVQNNNSVFRFSLGKPLYDWPAIETASCVLSLLKPRISIADLGFIFRSVYLGVVHKNSQEFDLFEQWLKRSRIRHVRLEQLPALLEECHSDLSTAMLAAASGLSSKTAGLTSGANKTKALLTDPKLPEFFAQLMAFRLQLNAELAEQKKRTGYATLSFLRWSAVFSEWLALWQWQAHAVIAEASPVTQQLRSRWENSLEEFANLAAVQKNISALNALNNFQQLIRDNVFLPKSAMSPVVVSGLLEALGREADHCFLTGMTQDYPPASKSDPFIPNRHLINTGYPDASPQSSVVQAQKVINSLLESSKHAHISFALSSESNGEMQSQASPLFFSPLMQAELKFVEYSEKRLAKEQHKKYEFEKYIDTQGPAWQRPEKARGGATIFKNQSHCAFKAFATHQLGFEVEDESEFGLDHLDRGNLMHKMLEYIWAQLPNQTALLELNAEQQTLLIEQTFEQLLYDSKDTLIDEKRQLLALEKRRVTTVLNDWLNVERKRPARFSVVERESRQRGQWAGIQFDYVIDRVDVTESGECVIVDYKTGLVSRKDWQGLRPYEPQLPLYTLARDEVKRSQVSGIAFAQVRRGEAKYVELAEAGIFNKNNRTTAGIEADWHASRAQWPELMTTLAEEFLAGKATVDPIDSAVCQYCELSTVCRLEELRNNQKQRSTAVEGSDDF